jgi:hypothetical protein
MYRGSFKVLWIKVMIISKRRTFPSNRDPHEKDQPFFILHFFLLWTKLNVAATLASGF